MNIWAICVGLYEIMWVANHKTNVGQKQKFRHVFNTSHVLLFLDSIVLLKPQGLS